MARQKSGTLISLFSLLLVVSLSACTGQQPSQPAQESAPESQDSSEKPSSTRVFIDGEGREVELPYPVTRAVVSNAYNAELIKGIGVIDRVVGVDSYIFADRDCYSMFDEDQVFSSASGETNYEKIVMLDPEVYILPGNAGYEEAEQQLSPFGIKVFVVNAYFTQDFERNCEMMGQIFGRETEAKELSDYFMDKLQYISDQLEGVEKKRVYFEYRNPGVTTIPGDYFFYMLEYAHADNLFRDAASRTLDIEAVVAENPDYIVKVSAPEVPFHYTPPTMEEQVAIREELKSRPGWDEINAIQEDNIFQISGYCSGGASKLVATCYIAKYLYPDLLPDLHPEQVFKDWQEQFQQLAFTPGHTYPVFSLVD